MTRHVRYGIGGFDPAKPNNNIIEEWDTPDTPTPLSGLPLMAALNAALEVWTVADAANVADVSEQELINEVLGWAAAAAGLNDTEVE